MVAYEDLLTYRGDSSCIKLGADVTLFICHVCGYAELDEPPWGEDGKTASFNICDCCGVEFGYEDATEDALLNYRNNWIASGAEWFDGSVKPSNWKLEEQLVNIRKTEISD